MQEEAPTPSAHTSMSDANISGDIAADVNASADAAVSAETPSENFLSIYEAAKIIGVSYHTMINWAHGKTGPPYYRFHSHFKYLRKDIEEWLEKCRILTEEPLVRVLSVPTAAKMIKMSPTRLWEAIQTGKGPPAYLFQGRYVFKEYQIIRWIEENNADNTNAN